MYACKVGRLGDARQAVPKQLDKAHSTSGMPFEPAREFEFEQNGLHQGGRQAALADQQLAGLIMWVPMGTVYLLAGAALAVALLEPHPPGGRPSGAGGPPATGGL